MPTDTSGGLADPSPDSGVTPHRYSPPHSLPSAPTYDRIYALVCLIPRGKVTTYGRIAFWEGTCTPRLVGLALRDLGFRAWDVPWQRVINSRGEISSRDEVGMDRQRTALESEGVVFARAGGKALDFGAFGWAGPDWEWLEANGYRCGGC